MSRLMLRIDLAEKLSVKFQNLPDKLYGGVKVVGEENVLKATVWEWGWVDLNRVGPKTMISTNPNGEERVLTITAPHGFIRSNHQQFLQILKDEYSKLQLGKGSTKQWIAKLKKMLREAGKRCADVISSAAPIDTGELRESIEGCDPDDPLLQQSDQGEFFVGEWQ